MEATFHGLTTNHAGERMNFGGGMEITGPVLFAAQPLLWCAGCEPVAAEAEAAPVAAGADDPGVSGHINPAWIDQGPARAAGTASSRLIFCSLAPGLWCHVMDFSPSSCHCGFVCVWFSVQVRKSVYVYVRAYVNAFTCACASVVIIWYFCHLRTKRRRRSNSGF